MHIKSTVLATGIVLCCVATALGSTADIVNSFFPSALGSNASGVVPPSERQSAFVVGDLNRDGTQLIAAGYCNGVSGAVALISASGGGSLLASIIPPGMRGSYIDIELVDFDRDGRPEIVANLRQARGLPIVWIYKWSGSSLMFVGPRDDAQSAEYSSDLADPTFVAMDGAIAVVDHHAGRWCDADGKPQASDQYRLLKWSAGELQVATVLDFFGVFVRANGAPDTQVQSFAVQDASVPRQMIILNGDQNGKNRISSAAVTLNGQPVVGPSAFNQETAALRLNVTLVSGDNRIGVKLGAKPGGTLSILVVPRQ